MIDKVHFRNFKGLRNVDIDLARLTVIVGPNASGKTSILEGIHGACHSVWRKPDEVFSYERHPSLLYSRRAVGEQEILMRSGTKQSIKFEAIPPAGYDAELVLSNPKGDSGVWQLQTSYQRGHGPWHAVSNEDHAILGSFSATLLRLDAQRLAAPSHSENARPVIAPNGDGLASCLAFVALNQPDIFAKIQERLRAIVPAVKRLRFDNISLAKVEQEIVTIDGQQFPRDITRSYLHDVIVFDFDHGSDIPSFMASAGTVIALGLLTVVLTPLHPRLVLIDDLEQGLHPQAQREVVRILKEVISSDNEIQVVATTHSPYVLDELEANQVLLTTTDSNGGTVCARLDEHPDYSQWEKEMAPGEFWTVAGEDWVKQHSEME